MGGPGTTVHHEINTPEDEKEIEMLAYYPDPDKHQKISFLKSAVRIIGYCFIPFHLWAAAIILIVSEILGFIEELV